MGVNLFIIGEKIMKNQVVITAVVIALAMTTYLVMNHLLDATAWGQQLLAVASLQTWLLVLVQTKATIRLRVLNNIVDELDCPVE
jgi:O-antigen/teichoic acid export membrane protein